MVKHPSIGPHNPCLATLLSADSWQCIFNVASFAFLVLFNTNKMFFILISVNVALHKKAWRFPDDMPGYEPMLATDGKIDFTLDSGSCTQSSPNTDPWFLVDLEKTHLVTEVKLLNTDANRMLISYSHFCKLIFVNMLINIFGIDPIFF